MSNWKFGDDAEKEVGPTPKVESLVELSEDQEIMASKIKDQMNFLTSEILDICQEHNLSQISIVFGMAEVLAAMAKIGNDPKIIEKFTEFYEVVLKEYKKEKKT